VEPTIIRRSALVQQLSVRKDPRFYLLCLIKNEIIIITNDHRDRDTGAVGLYRRLALSQPASYGENTLFISNFNYVPSAFPHLI